MTQMKIGITQMPVGTKFNFSKASLLDLALMPDISNDKTYTIEGHDEDGDAYFTDDVGDRNFAAAGVSLDGMSVSAGRAIGFVVVVD